VGLPGRTPPNLGNGQGSTRHELLLVIVVSTTTCHKNHENASSYDCIIKVNNHPSKEGAAPPLCRSPLCRLVTGPLGCQKSTNALAYSSNYCLRPGGVCSIPTNKVYLTREKKKKQGASNKAPSTHILGLACSHLGVAGSTQSPQFELNRRTTLRPSSEKPSHEPPAGLLRSAGTAIASSRYGSGGCASKPYP
jgi:hypothetical protein